MDEPLVDELARILERIEHGVLKPAHEQLDVHVDRAGRLQGESVVQGTVTEDASAIPFLLHPGFAVHKLEVDGTTIAPTQNGPVLRSVQPPRPVARGTALRIRARYSGEYAFGSRKTAAGERWYEFNLNTLWRPLFSLDLRDGARFRISASLPGRLRVVASMAEVSACSSAEATVCSWDTCANTSMDFSFVAGEGEYAERLGGTVIRALTMRGVPYSPDDVIAMAAEILAFYESLWGACPFRELTLACPPGSASGNCAREGLVIAGGIGDSDLGDGFGVLVHEIAHMWWGIGIRFDPTRPGCAEGLAAYSALLAHKKRFGKDALRTLVAESYLPWAREAEAHGTALLDCTLTMPHFEALRTGKGACVFLLLERVLGETTMAAALEAFAARFRGRSASPEDLQASLAAIGGAKVNAFFDAYLAGTEPLPDDVERYVG